MSPGRDVGLGDDDCVGGDLGFQRNRIAAAGHAHRLRVDGGSVVFTDHSVWSFVEADGAADLAGVEEGSDFSVGLLIKPETNFDSAFPGFEAVKFSVVNLLQRDGDFAVDEADFRGGGERAGALLIDEAGGDHHDEEERAGVNRGHPETLAAHGPERFAAGGAGGWQLDRLAALHFKQHHQRGQHEDGDEEEKFVADDGADDGHLLPRRGKHAVLGKLVQAGDYKLRGHKEKNRGGDPEEFLQIDLDAALD